MLASHDRNRGDCFDVCRGCGRQTGNIAYFLQASESTSQMGLAIANAYPGELRFTRVVR